jgi:hypothetical protein
MSARLIIGIAALVCVPILGILGTFCHIEMVETANSRLPVDLQFNPMGWYFQKTMRLQREYHRLFPGGSLVLRVRLLLGLAAVCLLICAWAIALF